MSDAKAIIQQRIAKHEKQLEEMKVELKQLREKETSVRKELNERQVTKDQKKRQEDVLERQFKKLTEQIAEKQKDVEETEKELQTNKVTMDSKMTELRAVSVNTAQTVEERRIADSSLRDVDAKLREQQRNAEDT